MGSKNKITITLDMFFALMSKYVSQIERDDLMRNIKIHGLVFNNTYYPKESVEKYLQTMESKVRLWEWRTLARR